ncbi:hypothetical protein NXW94_30310 [Bacteroides ovatus]|nr:hypothetical protein [Bacteroides ovatus]
MYLFPVEVFHSMADGVRSNHNLCGWGWGWTTPVRPVYFFSLPITETIRAMDYQLLYLDYLFTK